MACAPHGQNTPGGERSPSVVETRYGAFLLFATNEELPGADDDICGAFMRHDGTFGCGFKLDASSTDGYQVQMPSARQRGRRFEITLNSHRPGTAWNLAIGGQNAYLARGRLLPFWWSRPRNEYGG